MGPRREWLPLRAFVPFGGTGRAFQLCVTGVNGR
jgi:hypothetical protein